VQLLQIQGQAQNSGKLISGVGGGGSEGASEPPKVLICWKFWQNPWKSWQTWCPTLLDFKKCRPTFAEIHN